MGRGSSKASSGGSSSAGANTTARAEGSAINPNKPFNPTDFTTWSVGTKVDYQADDGAFGKGQVRHGEVTKVSAGGGRNDYLIVSADGMRLWVDKDTAFQFRAKKKR